ncbi:MAG: hypothetical protein ABJE66_24715 [Deltaproteobacteria bacterium]
MTKLSIILFATLAAASCGDNLKVSDGGTRGSDGGGSGSGFPAAPALGAQIDRMARPAINTALNHGFDKTAAAGTAKDAYNADGSPGGWTMYVPEFAKNLAILDSLDTGLTCVNGTCTVNAAATPGDGCGNQVEYNGTLTGGGTPTAMSYFGLAGVLSDDELYLDTNKGVSDLGNGQNYLAVEFNVLSSVNNASCGGRAPTNDVIDTSYAALAVGLGGFNNATFQPAFGDGASAHADVSNSAFPFLGAPH